ncbi:MAG: gliding motility-associated C-terminal domain-containing protein [Bacteroidota bacterium]
MKKIFFLHLLLLCIYEGASGTINPEDLIRKASAQATIKFTENKNQWDKKVLYQAQLDGGVLFLEKNCFTYNFYDKETLRKNHIQKSKAGTVQTPLPPAIKSHAFRMTLLGANESTEITSQQQTPDYFNFFIGQDKNKWAGNVKNFKEINYQNIYDGIGFQVLGLQNSIKYNFIVSPLANTDKIQLNYEGLDHIEIRKGALLLKTSINEISEQKPYAYQWILGKQVEVRCEFVLKNKTVGFRFPKGYDKNTELIIDPILVFASSSGSTADNFGMTATYDSQGCLYAGGTCYSQGYPVSTGAFDNTYNGVIQQGRTDVVITKYNSTGTALQYSTYLGGSTSTEIVSSLIVNSQNELMLFGATGSSDFPVTTSAFDVTFNGGTSLYLTMNGTQYLNGTDLYVTRFNSSGTAILASSYVGGSANDGANSSGTLIYNYGDFYRGEIQVDNAGNCYIASCTFSNDFPTTPGCSQPVSGGSMDGVVFKMDPTLSSLTWSTYVGGGADDGCYALVFDDQLNVYTTGGTASIDFPATSGALDTTYNGGSTDGFITKLKNDGSVIMNSTFIGTTTYDQSFLIQFDVDYDLYIIGQSEGVMPVTPGVYSNSNSKQFIWKVDSTLSTLELSTVFGNGSGQVNISPSAFLVDACGNIFVCGWGGNIVTSIPTTNMPVTSNALQPSTDGFNFYLFVLAPDAASLLYATYFGGGQSWEHVDGGTSRFDKKGIVYQAVCSGCGGHDDFPVTPGAWPNTGANVNHSTNCNQGVFKFDFQATGVNAELVTAPNDTICAGSSVSFNNVSINAFNYLWSFGDGSPISTTTSPSHIYTSAGNYDVMLVAIDSSGCILSDTANLTVIVLPPPSVNFGNDIILCQTPAITLDAGTSGTIYNWSSGANTQTISVNSAGSYWATLGNGACSDSDTINIIQAVKPDLGADTTLCLGTTAPLTAPAGALSYQWSTGAVSQTITVATAAQYWVTVNWGPCVTKDTINILTIAYPSVSLPGSVNVCPGDSITLDPGNSLNTNYLWSTGNTTQSVSIHSGGTYFVTASVQHCIIADTTVVIGLPPIPLEDNIAMCNIEKYTLDAGTGISYLWSTGETTQKIDVTTSGKYWVVVTTALCTLSDTINVAGSFDSGALWLPNTFTPNGDLLNDIFLIKGVDITYFQLMIFNRWGDLLFETKNIDSGWDGTIKGKIAEQGVYVWKVKYKTLCSKDESLIKIGHVALIR